MRKIGKMSHHIKILISLFLMKQTDLSAQSKRPKNLLNQKAPELNIEAWVSEKPELKMNPRVPH